MAEMNRRSFIKMFGIGGAASIVAGCASSPAVNTMAEIMPKKGRRVVVIGGGYGGMTAAKYIRMNDSTIEVVMVERNPYFVSCPFSNLVIGGNRQMSDITVTYDKLEANHGIKRLQAEVTNIDGAAKKVVTDKGTLTYDRLVLSPGIDFRLEEIEGYDKVATPQVIPHAWKAGDQTVLLRKQLTDMKDGGTVVLSVPLSPFRCPPGPYERASQIAFYLKKHKPKSKVLILDANPNIASKGKLFTAGWKKYYDGMIEFRGAQKVTKVDTANKTVWVEGLDAVRGDVVNLVPPQRAGDIAFKAGVVGPDKKWCPVDAVTFESTQVPGIHVIGDACIAGAMPKSGHSANAEAKVCALNIVALLNNRETVSLSSTNTCYSFITDKEAVSVAGVYRVEGGKIVSVKGSGGVSPDLSEMEAIYAESWLHNILTDIST